MLPACACGAAKRTRPRPRNFDRAVPVPGAGERMRAAPRPPDGPGLARTQWLAPACRLDSRGSSWGWLLRFCGRIGKNAFESFLADSPLIARQPNLDRDVVEVRRQPKLGIELRVADVALPVLGWDGSHLRL